MNDQFQHVMVLISIIIGLAVTYLLSGVVDAVDRANDEDEPEISGTGRLVQASVP